MSVGYGEVLSMWAHDYRCFATHDAKAIYIVTGDNEARPTCGDHLSRAVRDVSASTGSLMVTVWVRP